MSLPCFLSNPNTYGDIENSALYIRYKVALRDLYTENKSLYFESYFYLVYNLY